MTTPFGPSIHSTVGDTIDEAHPCDPGLDPACRDRGGRRRRPFQTADASCTGASSAALKYALLPELQDTTPGNAVDHYRQAIKNLKQDAPPERDWHPTLDQWMAAPLKDFPREDVAKFLKPCESTFKEVEAGAAARIATGA